MWIWEISLTYAENYFTCDRFWWLWKNGYVFDNKRKSLEWCQPGADLGFSRGGGADFQKIFQNFHDLFFRSTKLIFRALPKHCFAPILDKFCAPQANFWKNSQKKPFLGTFWKILTKNSVFFGARSPSKLVYISAEGVFRKSLGSVGQKWISEKKGTLWVGRGSNPWGGCPPLIPTIWLYSADLN